MPAVKTAFVVNAPMDRTWAYLSDIRNIGSCVPHCTVRVIGPTQSKWEITAAVGVMVKHIAMDVTLTACDPRAHHVAFSGSGSMITMKGTLDLRRAGEGTEVMLDLNLRGRGLAGPLIDGAIETKTDAQAAKFAQAVKSALE